MFGIFLIFVVQSFATGYLPQSRPLAGLKTPPPGHEAAEREFQRTIVSPKPLFLMSFYKKVFNEKNGVWYPAAVVVGQPVPVKQVAKRLSQMCTATYADVMAVLGELPGVMADYMSQGKSVRLDGLGTFRYTLHTKGVETEDEFDFQKQLRAVRVQFVPQREGAVTKGSTATRALVPTNIEWLEYNEREEESTETQEPTEPGGEDEGEEGTYG